MTTGPFDTRFYYRHRNLPALCIAYKTNLAVHIGFWSGTEHRALCVNYKVCLGPEPGFAARIGERHRKCTLTHVIHHLFCLLHWLHWLCNVQIASIIVITATVDLSGSRGTYLQ